MFSVKHICALNINMIMVCIKHKYDLGVYIRRSYLRQPSVKISAVLLLHINSVVLLCV
jgi:hypothetical protein